jgi:ATP-dependent RNA helicase RhlE
VLFRSISLVCIDEDEYLINIEKLIKKDIPKVWLKGFKPDPSIKAEPINQGGGGRGRGGNSRSRPSNKAAQSRAKSKDASSRRR